MLANWLFHASVGMTLLIGLIMLLRPVARQWLGAQVAYWLWLLLPLKLLLLDRLQRPGAVLVSSVLPSGRQLLNVLPQPGTLVMPASLPLEYLWLAGLMLWCLYRSLLWWRSQHYLLAHSDAMATLPAALSELDAVGLSGVDCRRTDLPGAPFVTGLCRPCIYLPNDVDMRFRDGSLRWVLLHELAHIRRGDLWAQLLGESLRALFWFNPVAHLAWRLFCQDQEMACDHEVLRECSHAERHAYGRALLHALHAPAYVQTLMFSTHPKERFKMLEKHKTSRLAHACGLLLCASVAVFAVAQPSAELSHAAPWEDQPITLNFEQVPLATVVSTVFQFGGQTPSGLDQLPTTPVNIRIKDVPLKGALGVLLGCNGYTWQARGQGYEILRAKNDAKVTDPARCMREAQSNAK